MANEWLLSLDEIASITFKAIEDGLTGNKIDIAITEAQLSHTLKLLEEKGMLKHIYGCALNTVSWECGQRSSCFCCLHLTHDEALCPVCALLKQMGVSK